jgi:surfeit locus 1 family protein
VIATRQRPSPQKPPPRRSWLGLLVPALLAFAILLGLGTWQLQRKAWKEALIATLTQRAHAPPGALPGRAEWASLDPQDDEFRHVKFSATFDTAKEALVYAVPSAFRSDVSGPGYWMFTPARLPDGGIVMVNRGYVPEARKDPATRAQGQVAGVVDIVGIMRWPEAPGWFTPAAEPAKNLWFARDPLAIAAAKGLAPVAPFYVEQEAPTPPGGLPHPAATEVHLRDEHLQYALTWFGLAIVLVVVFGAWVRSSRREGRSSGPGEAGHQGPETG